MCLYRKILRWYKMIIIEFYVIIKYIVQKFHITWTHQEQTHERKNIKNNNIVRRKNNYPCVYKLKNNSFLNEK